MCDCHDVFKIFAPGKGKNKRVNKWIKECLKNADYDVNHPSFSGALRSLLKIDSVKPR